MKISSDMISLIKEIENNVYPPAYQQMQEVESYKDLKRYCEGKPHLHVWEGGYLLYTKREIVDLCSVTKMSIKDIHEICNILRKFYKNRKVYVDLREKTSYRIFRYLQKRGYLKIKYDEAYDWSGETFHDVCFKFTKEVRS
jgi:hypothetical protein